MIGHANAPAVETGTTHDDVVHAEGSPVAEEHFFRPARVGQHVVAIERAELAAAHQIERDDVRDVAVVQGDDGRGVVEWHDGDFRRAVPTLRDDDLECGRHVRNGND